MEREGNELNIRKDDKKGAEEVEYEETKEFILRCISTSFSTRYI
jgi:hypothetical protein